MKRIVEWFIQNPIAANLLMVVILFVGLKNIPTVGKTVFPQTDQSNITISAAYNGASPSEVEQQVVVRLEEAIADLEGIDEIFSSAREGVGQVTLTILEDYDGQRLLNDAKTRIDGITTLPDEVDTVNVREVIPKRPLMSIAIHGNADEQRLKETAQWLRDEMTLLPSIASVDIEGVRNNEMSIEVSENTLRQYQLTLEQIATSIRRSSLNVPGGTVKTDAGNVQVQTRGQAYTEQEFANIVITANDDGAQLLLGDIATITDGFADEDSEDNFNGQPAAYLELYTTTPPDVLDAAAETKAAIDQLRPRLPANMELTIWRDRSLLFESRMNLLLKNAVSGLVLVFVVLMLFLTPTLAGWVSLGIATSFVGVFVLLPYTGITINMLSMYGFLLALGIVVDDAIIVGESVYASQRRGEHGIAAAMSGTLFVYKPVLFAVISTVIFFSGIFGLPGWMGSLAYPIGVVVIVCLLFSLIESLLILPSHLSHSKKISNKETNNRNVLFFGFSRLREKMSLGMEALAEKYYRPFLEKSLRVNGQTLTLFLMFFVIVMAMYLSGGYVKSSFKVQATSNSIRISATLPEGVAFADVKRVQQQIEQAAYALKADQELVSINGEQPFIRAIRSVASNNSVRVRVALLPAEDRTVNILQVKDRWRDTIGELAGVKELDLRYTINANRKALRFRVNVTANNQQVLADSVRALKQTLAGYESVYDIEDTLEGSRKEVELRIKPHAEVLGLRLADIAAQIRQGFYGEEIQRIPRGTDDIKVMLRYPESERKTLEQIEDIYIRTQDGRSVPLASVADVVDIAGYSVINRENRRRTIIVSAELTEGVDALLLATQILNDNLPRWQQQYTGLTIEAAGSLTAQKEFNSTLYLNMLIAVFVSYGLMAIAFRSYWQPLLILTAIPFGFVGAILGHLIMDKSMSIMSMLGLLACAGVVVNDNLVLLDRIQYLYKKGLNIIDVLAQAGQDRFRAIILTSLTTFVGLLPIMFETSVQAQFLIPMVISLSFGVLFSTFVTLLLVPNLFLLGIKLTAGNDFQENKVKSREE
ncbi:MAG: multidrug efflux pump subunit AcrB [Candidatus Endobugula sp.]|jgi:multidrug efflux pump subunit AcrB